MWTFLTIFVKCWTCCLRMTAAWKVLTGYPESRTVFSTIIMNIFYRRARSIWHNMRRIWMRKKPRKTPWECNKLQRSESLPYLEWFCRFFISPYILEQGIHSSEQNQLITEQDCTENGECRLYKLLIKTFTEVRGLEFNFLHAFVLSGVKKLMPNFPLKRSNSVDL